MGRLGGTFDSETSASPRWSASLTVYDTLLSCLQVQNGGGENHDSKTTAFIQALNTLACTHTLTRTNNKDKAQFHNYVSYHERF